VLYAVAVAILLTYALLVFFTTDTGRGVGFISFGAIVLMDVAVFVYNRAGLLTSPTLLTLTLTGIRAALVAWGPLYVVFMFCPLRCMREFAICA